MTWARTYDTTADLSEGHVDTVPTSPRSTPSGRLWRSRWAAIGAAIAVTLGGGGLFFAQAAPSDPSVVIAVDPTRVLDTRDGNDVGLAGPFVSPTPLDLMVTGEIPTSGGPQTVVPLGATAVFLNVTVRGPQADGFVSVRPANATGAPSASNLNFTAGSTFPNAVLVQVPTSGDDAGKIEITYDALGVTGPTADMLVDIVGYTVAAGGGDVNAADVAANAADIATNKGNIEANTADIATNTADIATNTGNLATNTADIATNTSDIATNTADIATNAGNISTAASNISNLGSRVDGLEANLLDRTVFVSGDGTDSQNGDRLDAAITATSGATSADPWTIVLDAGVFDLGATGITLPDYVSLVGIDQRGTQIDGTSLYILETGDGSAVENLSIDNTGSSSNSAVINVQNDAEVVLRNLTVRGSDSKVDGIRTRAATDAVFDGLDVSVGDFAVSMGIGGSNIAVRNSVLISATDGTFGAGNNGDVATIDGSAIISNGASGTSALVSFGGDVTVRHSTLISGSGGILTTFNASSAPVDVLIFNSHIDTAEGLGNLVGGSIQCAGISDPAPAFFDSSCTV